MSIWKCCCLFTWAPLVILIVWCCHHVSGGACYHCLSSENDLNPSLRRHLRTQHDVFFWQQGIQWPACSAEVDPQNPSIEAQICSTYDLCVTLQPNVNGSTFVVRGCLENVLRITWREDRRLHKEGCFMVRSIPMYPNKNILDYVICVCRGDYCNSQAAVGYVDGIVDLLLDSVLQISGKDDEASAVSSAASVFTALTLLTVALH